MSARPPSLAIVIPVLDESAGIVACLQALAPMRARGVQVLVVDGGSADATAALAAPHADQVLTAPRGRALQLNAGAQACTADAILFLHADTRLPPLADALIQDALAHHAWGRFDVRIAGTHPMLRVIAAMMNLRSRVSGIATGDQAMFVRREVFLSAGGFPEIALMEDIALSRALKHIGPPACLRAKVLTSGRRWERGGVWRTMLLMWRLRLAYFFGADPARLALRYRHAREAG